MGLAITAAQEVASSTPSQELSQPASPATEAPPQPPPNPVAPPTSLQLNDKLIEEDRHPKRQKRLLELRERIQVGQAAAILTRTNRASTGHEPKQKNKKKFLRPDEQARLLTDLDIKEQLRKEADEAKSKRKPSKPASGEPSSKRRMKAPKNQPAIAQPNPIQAVPAVPVGQADIAQQYMQLLALQALTI